MTTIVNANGEMLMQVHGSAEVIALNTPEGGILVSDPPHDGMYYDHALQAWAPLPPSPGSGFSFNYASKSWVDTRSLYDVRTAKWDEIKMQREQLEFGGFEYKGNIYDSDQVSQGRIMGAAIAGIDQVWTLANNTTVTLTGDELKELYAALQMHVAELHERGRIARYNIDVAMTPQDIEAVEL